MESPVKPDLNTLMKFVTGFQSAKVFFVANDLEIFGTLSPKPRTYSEVASGLGLSKRGTEILLDALVALGLLIKEGGYYRNSLEAEEFLVPEKPTYRGHFFKMMHDLWRPWSELEHAVQHGCPKESFAEQLFRSEKYNRQFILGTENMKRDVAEEIAHQLDLCNVRHMLDLGGGSGIYAITFAKKFPQLKATVFDLPLTIKVAEEMIAHHRMEDRVKVMIGDFWKDEISSGYDLVWISSIIHAFSAEENPRLIKKAFSALERGGQIILCDYFLQEDKTGPLFAALFSVNFLAVSQGGRNYTYQEASQWLKEAGFINLQKKRESETINLLLGYKPA